MPSSEHLGSTRKMLFAKWEESALTMRYLRPVGLPDKSLRALTTLVLADICLQRAEQQEGRLAQEEDETLRLEDTNEFCRYRLDSYTVKARHSYKLLLRLTHAERITGSNG